MHETLEKTDMPAVRALAFSLDKFEPYPTAIIPAARLDALVNKGLAERGESCRRAVAPIGYRLTGRGWEMATEYWTVR